jgi:hypothetical protein
MSSFMKRYPILFTFPFHSWWGWNKDLTIHPKKGFDDPLMMPTQVCMYIMLRSISHHIGGRFEVLWPLELGGRSHCNFTNWNVTNVRRDNLTWFGWNVLFILLAFTCIHYKYDYHIVQKSKFVKNWWVRFWTMISKTNGGAFITKLIVDYN